MFDLVEVGGGAQKEIARIAICQLELTEQLVQLPDRPLSKSAESKLLRKIRPLLASLQRHKPDLIQFPELTIPETLLPELQEYSNANKCIIIAGTHYRKTPDGPVSVCPVIFPNKKIYFSEKFTVSPLEKNVIIEDSVVPGDQQYMFYDTSIGNFVVLICSDFLDREMVGTAVSTESDLDFVFISSCQNESGRYYAKMSDLCRDSQEGLYFCYSNLTWEPHGDGGSAIFGNVDMSFMQGVQHKGVTDSKPREKIWAASRPNDYVVADFDLEHRKAHLSKSVRESPNIQIRARWETDQVAARNAAEGLYKVVAFDMDGTILRDIKYSWALLWEHCGDKGELWRTHLADYRKKRISYEEWCHKAVGYFESYGLSMEEVINLAKEKARLTSNFYEGIALLKKSGFKIGLISGGVDLFLKAVIPDYREVFDYVYINKLHLDSEGKVCGVTPTKYDFAGKADALEEICDQAGCDLEQAIFVGDRFNDEAALEKAGLSIVYSQSEDVVGETAHHKIEEDDFLKLAELILRSNRFEPA